MENIILHPFELRELAKYGEVELVRPIVPAPAQFTTVTGGGAVWPLDEQERRMRCAVGNPGEESRVLEAWGYWGSSTYRDEHKASVQYLVDGARREVSFFTFEEMCAATPRQEIEYPMGYDEMDDYVQERIHDKLMKAWWQDVKTLAAETMPVWACRYLFRVSKVRCARLGAGLWTGRMEWERLWNELYPDYPVDSDPWCWVAVGTCRSVE